MKKRYFFNKDNVLQYKQCHCWLLELQAASLLEASRHVFHPPQTTTIVAILQSHTHRVCKHSKATLKPKKETHQALPLNVATSPVCALGRPF